jgi:hypothetical protein
MRVAQGFIFTILGVRQSLLDIQKWYCTETEEKFPFVKICNCVCAVTTDRYFCAVFQRRQLRRERR